MAAPIARVLRDGQETVVPARELVPGDVVLLRAGDRVPADTRLTQAVNLAIDEAALTGESEPAQKTIGAFDDPRLPLGDRRNMTYAGTLVVHGRGQGVVVSTGMSTEFGRIARMVDTVEVSRTPLQENLDRLGGTLGKAALVVVGAGRRHRSAARPARRSRCSCSASPWRLPSSPRRCRRSSRSRWRSACGAWSSGTRSCGVCRSSRRWAAHRSSVPTRPAR